MKKIKSIQYLLATVVVALGLSACDTPFNEISSLDLNRCLEPMNLNAKVNASLGDVVTFNWDVSKDADSYILTVFTDAQMTQKYLTETVSPSSVPYVKKLDADQTYYFTVQATADRKQPSKIAAYDKAIKTFAVKDNLYLKVAARTADAITVKWSNEVEDYLEVTHIDYGLPGAEEPAGTVTLTDGQKAAAEAVIPGLAASTEYVITLYYLSASRGQVDAWTAADTEGFTTVETVEALKNALTTPGAKILLTMAGSPYAIESLDIANGFTLVGQASSDGTMPVIQGEFHFADTWTPGAGLYFENVELNGAPTAASPSGFGFAIQNKNGGTVKGKEIGDITYKNCVITNFTKGLIYEWGNQMVLGNVTYDCCDINNINTDGTQGGDVFDIRQATSIEKLTFYGNTVYQGMRTFIRIDAGTMGALVFENNTLHNLDFVDNTNNAGVFGLQITPGEFSFKNNLIVNMTGKAVLAGANAKYVPASSMGVAAANNWFYNLPKDDSGALTYFTDNFTLANASGTILDADPCYNAPAGLFNIVPDSDIAGKKVGAPRWWTPYVEEPEDLTLTVIEGNHTWNFGNAKLFSGTIKKQMVRDQLFINTSDAYPIVVSDAMLNFQGAAATDRKGVPTVNVLQFKVNAPGSLVIKAQDPVGKGAHFVVGVGPVAGGEIALKGGVSAIAESDTPTKILMTSITEESMVYIYPSGPVSLEKLAWSTDVTPVNTALPTPEPKAAPASVTQGDATDVTVSWDPVENAGSYSVVFSGKTYTVDETSYTIEGKTIGMLDPGSFKVEVYANPTKDDLYNTESAAGVATFAVLPAGGGGGGDEFIVKSVEELLNAIAAGKDAITLQYSETPYEVGALALTAPLHLKGQSNGDRLTPVTMSITLSGEIGGSVVLRDLEFVGDGTSVLIDDKTAAPVADTVAIFDSYLHGTKALYDNSGKAASNVQYVIFSGNLIDNCSNGADFIDMRAGAHHNFVFTNNTVANSCRTFVRTDAGHEMNTALIRNNTFYKVATNSSSKDNNGIFHIRSAAGSGLYSYEVSNNFFYSILIDTDPEHANGFPKLRSKGGITPITFSNNYYFNCEDREERAAYGFWAYVSKEESLADGGAIVPSDPCQNAEAGDFTLTNGVMMNAGVGDPRWNPMAGSTPSSEITVSDADALLTAISAGKQVITLEDGMYDVSAAPVVVNSALTLVGGKNTVVVGKFELAPGATRFELKGFTLDGNDALDNAFYVQDGAKVTAAILSDMNIRGFKNRLFYQDKESSSVGSLLIDGALVTGMGTSGDFIDFRKGTLTALKVTGSTFANGIRTFARIDAAVVCNSILVENNTFFNLCSVDSKDNNGIFHVRSTSVNAAGQLIVRNNLFANMKRTAEAPSNAQGFPKLVSKASSAIALPAFSHNYFSNVDSSDEAYSWWAYSAQDVATAGYGVVLTADVFRNAAEGDFTVIHSLVASENVGDPRWIKTPGAPGEPYRVANVESLMGAIAAGKTTITLQYGTYDLTGVEGADAGCLVLTGPVTLQGESRNGLKPEVIGGFKLAVPEGSFVLENLKLNGVYSKDGAENKVGNMIDIDASSIMENIVLKDCEIFGYGNRLVSGAGTSSLGALEMSGLMVHDFGTSGDFIDFRKGTVGRVSVTNNTFYNGIRTFVRIDAAVQCGAVTVENNTFFNLCSVDSKDNNGIMHVRSSAAVAPAALESAARRVVVRKNIFAAMHKAAEAPSNANGFPKLVSTASEKIAHPYITDNLFFDIETTEGFSWWNTMTPEDIEAAGQVLEETPFTGEPALGKFTVKAAYKGYGDKRW